MKEKDSLMPCRTRCDIQKLSLKKLFKNRGDSRDVQFLIHRRQLLEKQKVEVSTRINGCKNCSITGKDPEVCDT